MKISHIYAKGGGRDEILTLERLFDPRYRYLVANVVRFILLMIFEFLSRHCDSFPYLSSMIIDIMQSRFFVLIVEVVDVGRCGVFNVRLHYVNMKLVSSIFVRL